MSNQNRSPWLVAGALLAMILVCIICATGAGIIGLRYWLLAQSSVSLTPIPPLIIGTQVPAVIDTPIPTANPAVVASPTTDPLNAIPVGSEWFVLGKGAIRDIELSPDRQYMAVACAEYLYIYTTLTHEELWRIPTPGPIKQIDQISWSPDSHNLVAHYFGDFDAGQTVIWDVRRREEKITLSGQDVSISSFGWSQDGSKLASLTNNSEGSLIVWDVESGEILFSSPGDSGGEVTWSSDGQYLIHDSLNKVVVRNSKNYSIVAEVEVDDFRLSGSTNLAISGYRDSDGHGVLEWNIATGEAVHRLPDVELVTNAWSPDNTSFVVTNEENEIHIVDASSGATLKKTNRCTLSEPYIVWSSGSDRIFMTSVQTTWGQNSLCQWNLVDGSVSQIGEDFESAVNTLAWLEPDRQLLLSLDTRVQVVNIETGLSTDVLTEHIPAQASAVWSPDGQTIASGGGRRIVLWNTTSREIVRSWDTTSADVLSLAYRSDGAQLAAFSSWNTVTIWNTRTGQVEHMLTGDKVRVIHGIMWHSALSWSHDGKYLVAGFVGHLIVWDTYSWERYLTIPLPYDTYPAIIDFSPDSQHLVYGWSGNLFTLSLESSRQESLFEEVYGFYWLPDGDMMALSRALDGAVLWNTSTDKETNFSIPLYADSRPFGSFAPGGNLFAALVNGPYQFTQWQAVIWDTKSGLPVEKLDFYSPSDTPHLDWSPDGAHLTIPSGYGTVVVWDIATPLE